MKIALGMVGGAGQIHRFDQNAREARIAASAGGRGWQVR